jgi:hypothetical protein
MANARKGSPGVPLVQGQVQPRVKGAIPNTAHANTQSSNAPTTLGFVSATQIPAGGAIFDRGYMGDFNGDGKRDVLSVIEQYQPAEDPYVFFISAVLGNGNGTFQAPVLTPVNSTDPLLIGDLNGDGKDDLIQIHPENSPSTFDVWLSNGDGTFKQGNSYQVSPAQLNGGMFTDVNGDGKLDLVAIDAQTPGLVRTLLGNGDGTFQAATSVTLATVAPTDLIFSDFNGDDKPDFAGLNSNGQVVIYLQEGGNFVQTGAALTTPDSTYNICGMAGGDLNGDGASEVVTANCNGEEYTNAYDINTITIYVNNGSGGFATGVYYDEVNTGGTSPSNGLAIWPVIADVNGDGKADIILDEAIGGDEAILLGNGDGTVKVPNVAYATGGSPYNPALVADFNGDGLPDIMQPDSEFSYAYLQGYGDGTFRAAVDYYGPVNDNTWPQGYAIATGDFNGDGIKDFAVGNWGSNSVGLTVFLSRGDGSLKPGVNYGIGPNVEAVAVADFNGDGKLDIAVSFWDADTVQIFTGNGDGTFNAGTTYSAGNACGGSLVVGDFNHDGHPDIAIANGDGNQGSPSVGILLNDGTGNFEPVVLYPASNDVWQIAAGDINGDGYDDLLLPMDNALVAVFLGNNDNSGTFQAEYDINLVNGGLSYYAPEFITLADFNNDGKLDFATTITPCCDPTDTQGVVVALGNGDGTFQTPNLYSTTNQDYYFFDDPYPFGVVSADINGDGILDLVYTNAGFGTVGIVLGNGDGSFGLPSEYPAGNNAFALAVADVNGDGAPDVVTDNFNADAVTVLLNANGNPEKPDFTATATTASATVKAGSSATYDLTVTGKNGYTSAISFTCSGLPSKATCSFSPATVTTAGNDPQATVLTISTTAASTTTTTASLLPAGANSNSKSNSGSRPLLASLSALGLFGFVLAAGGKNRARGQAALLLGVMLVGISFTLVGCSGVSTPASPATTVTVPGTPAGTYTVTVTSTGAGTGAPSHSMKLTLVVQ